MDSLNTILMEALKVGGPVVLLIVLGYLERKSILDRHYDVMRHSNEVLSKQGELLREILIIMQERLK